jgi:hypothetical protein
LRQELSKDKDSHAACGKGTMKKRVLNLSGRFLKAFLEEELAACSF